MDAERIERQKCYERVVSSGMIFSDQVTVHTRSKNLPPLHRMMFLLIEEEMELSLRSQNCLDRSGIRLIGQLVQKTTPELIALRNFGMKSLREIEKTLAEAGLSLGMPLDFPPWQGDEKDAELIRILLLQQAGGGFAFDHKAADVLGVEMEEVCRCRRGGKKRQQWSVLSTRHLLQRLEAEYQQYSPCLAEVIHRHMQWLQEQCQDGRRS